MVGHHFSKKEWLSSTIPIIPKENITNYIEIFIDTPLSELKKRDPKKIYRDFELGLIINVAGIDLKIDIPSNPDIHLKWSDKSTIDSMFNELVNSILLGHWLR